MDKRLLDLYIHKHVLRRAYICEGDGVYLDQENQSNVPKYTTSLDNAWLMAINALDATPNLTYNRTINRWVASYNGVEYGDQSDALAVCCMVMKHEGLDPEDEQDNYTDKVLVDGEW